MKKQEQNGNNYLKLMHLVVFHELNKISLSDRKIEEICPEKTVLLEKRGKECVGRFDFLVREKDKTVGIEVLGRPTKGKMKQKLAYAESVDEFIFAIPENSLELYRKHKKLMHEQARPSFFPEEFNNKKLKTWLIDLPRGKISEKGCINKFFNVK